MDIDVKALIYTSIDEIENTEMLWCIFTFIHALKHA